MADKKSDDPIRTIWNPQTVYILDINVYRGIGLLKADILGKSDPYLKVQCLHRTFNTDVVKKTLDPEWNASTQFRFLQQPPNVMFRCIDWNIKPPNTPIGNYNLQIKDEYFQKNSEGKYIYHV